MRSDGGWRRCSILLERTGRRHWGSRRSGRMFCYCCYCTMWGHGFWCCTRRFGTLRCRRGYKMSSLRNRIGGCRVPLSRWWWWRRFLSNRLRGRLFLRSRLKGRLYLICKWRLRHSNRCSRRHRWFHLQVSIRNMTPTMRRWGRLWGFHRLAFRRILGLLDIRFDILHFLLDDLPTDAFTLQILK